MRRSSLFLAVSLLATSLSAEPPRQRVDRFGGISTREIPGAAGTLCGTVGGIRNFRITNVQGNTVVFAWDQPAGTDGPSYEIVRESGSTYCNIGSPTVVARVTQPTYTATLSPSDQAFGYYVQLVSNQCVTTEFAFVVDSFTKPPQKPPTPTLRADNGQVSATVSYSDGRAFAIRLQRMLNDGNFLTVDIAETCDADPKVLVDTGSDLGGRLPNGGYQYRLFVFNAAGAVVSDTVSITLGVQQPAPRIVSFNATPIRIRAGQSATLSFVTENATTVMIDNGLGAQRPSGTVTVTPIRTTTYTLTAVSGNQTVTSSVTVEVFTEPSVSISSFPAALIQPVGVGSATSSFSLTNNGGGATTVFLSQSANFFTLSSTSFILQPGATQEVTITATPQQLATTFDGFVLIDGVGVPPGLRVPVRLLSAAPPAAPVVARPVDTRVDTSGGGNTQSGSARFSNTGAGVLTGTVVADVPWIIPQVTTVTIPPGGTVAVPFTIDRSQRPDSDLLAGSQSGSLSLYYISGGGAGKGTIEGNQTPGAGINISKATVVDTVTPQTGSGAPPALGANEVALFIAGLGHVQGTVGLFISDISILNPLSNRSINDIRFFYTPTTASNLGDTRTANVALASARAVTVGDIVKTTFNQDTQGTLQLRSADADKLNVNATVFNSSNPTGTYGTTIPIIRSDRGVGSGGNVVLTGLRRDASSHTNLYLQEVTGNGITIQTEFIAADGSTVGTRSDDLGPFGLKQIGQIVPEGAVSAILTTTSSNARFQAFATPVDRASGDTWSVADWATFYGYATNSTTVIPVAGVLQGAGNTFFRTDAAIMNRGTGQATGTLRYFGRTGDQFSRTVSLGSRQAMVISDIVGTFFGAANGSVGYITFTPTTGDFAVTSRTYTTVANQAATFGTGVPTIAAASSLRRGAVRAIASLDDTAVASVVAARPATFRTNFGILETAGANVKVRVTLKFTFPAGPKVSGVGSATKDYDLSPNQFLLVNGIAADIIGAARNTLGDLRNIEADFQVIDGDGAVLVFTSSVDNGTGDTILRVD